MMASDADVYRVMSAGREHGLAVQVHCENGDMIAELTRAALDAGRTGVRSFFETRPPIAEEESVHRVLCLAELTGAPVYLVHLSTSGALDHVRAARRRGVSAWAEAVTWGLMLDDSVIEREDPRVYMAAPPPRSREHVEAVWAAVADGTLDTLGSDHHERTYAPPDAPDFTGIPYSIRGIRVRLPMLLGEGLRRGVPIAADGVPAGHRSGSGLRSAVQGRAAAGRRRRHRDLGPRRQLDDRRRLSRLEGDDGPRGGPHRPAPG